MQMSLFLSLLDELRRDVASDLTLLTLRVFLYICEKGECTQRDIETHLGCTNATASRNVSYWSNQRFDGQPGMNFVTREIDTGDRRQRKIRLNTQGLAFFEKIRIRIEA